MNVLGFDTETFNGAVKVLTCSNGKFVETSDTDGLLGFAYEISKDAGYRVFWNLGFDSASILKPFVVDNAAKLRKSHYRKIAVAKRLKFLASQEIIDHRLSDEEQRERKRLFVELDGMETVERFDTPKFHIQLIGSKGMGVKPHRPTRAKTQWFFDAAVFYVEGFGGGTLEANAQKYLGEGKSDVAEGIDRAKIGSELGYYEKNREAIIRYSIRDSELTARLMSRTISGFAKLGYAFPERPFSKGSVSKAILEQNGCLTQTQQRYERIKESAYRGFWTHAYQGGIFLLRVAGTFKNPYVLDINSAYPDALMKFPSMEGAVVVEGTHPLFSSAFFKFYKIRCKPTPRTPLKERSSLRKIYGYGDKEMTFYVTEPDLDAMSKWGDDYTIEESVGVYCPSQERPFGWLANTFKQKADAKVEFGSDSIEYLNIKIVANGVYGIIAQRRPRESKFTNLIYAAYTTALCRKKLWAMAREMTLDGEKILQYATDGLIIEDRNESAIRNVFKETSSEALGEWSFEEHDSITFFETGVYVVSDKDRQYIKKRGFPELTPDLLRNCKQRFYESKRQSPIKLKTAIIQSRTEDINVFMDVDRVLCPVKSFFDAGMTYPKALDSAPLADYFGKSWDLRLKGEP